MFERYHYDLPLPQLTNLVQLAIALLFGLGLHKAPNGNDEHEVLVEETKCPSERLDLKRRRTLEERRAFLGLFWLTNVYVFHFI